jgi:hypothetical protein
MLTLRVLGLIKAPLLIARMEKILLNKNVGFYWGITLRGWLRGWFGHPQESIEKKKKICLIALRAFQE